MADKPKVVLGPGAVCCGAGCGMGGCEAPAAPAPAPKAVDLSDDMAGGDA